MDTLASAHSIVQMSDNNLSPAAAETTVTLKKHYNDHHHGDDDVEVDENQQNNGLKRHHPSDCVHDMSATMKNHNELPPCQQQQQQQQQKCAYEQKVRKLAGDASPSIRLKHDSKGNADHVDHANFLTKFCENHNPSDGYFGALISSDPCDATVQLSDEKAGRKMRISDTVLLNGNGSSTNGDCVGGGGDDDADDVSSDRVIIKGHRRTRARSTDSIQMDLYKTRKQLRLRSQNTAESEVSVAKKKMSKPTKIDLIFFETSLFCDFSSVSARNIRTAYRIETMFKYYSGMFSMAFLNVAHWHNEHVHTQSSNIKNLTRRHTTNK